MSKLDRQEALELAVEIDELMGFAGGVRNRLIVFDADEDGKVDLQAVLGVAVLRSRVERLLQQLREELED